MNYKVYSKKDITLEEYLETCEPIIKNLMRPNKGYVSPKASYDEIYSEGINGAFEAWEKYDESKGSSIYTYAFYWIRVHIQRGREFFNNTRYWLIPDFNISFYDEDPFLDETNKYKKKLINDIINDMSEKCTKHQKKVLELMKSHNQVEIGKIVGLSKSRINSIVKTIRDRSENLKYKLEELESIDWYMSQHHKNTVFSPV